MKKTILITVFLMITCNNLISDVYYLAYGSNLNRTQMKERIGDCEFIGIGCLPNYILKFNKKSAKSDNVYANIEPQQNSCVYGAVYKLANEQLAKMDKFEGFISYENLNNHYEKQEFEVTLLDKEGTIKVIAYVAANKYRLSDTTFKPTAIYLKTIIDGASETGIPKSYIDDINAKADLRG